MQGKKRKSVGHVLACSCSVLTLSLSLSLSPTHSRSPSASLTLLLLSGGREEKAGMILHGGTPGRALV